MPPKIPGPCRETAADDQTIGPASSSALNVRLGFSQSRTGGCCRAFAVNCAAEPSASLPDRAATDLCPATLWRLDALLLWSLETQSFLTGRFLGHQPNYCVQVYSAHAQAYYGNAQAYSAQGRGYNASAPSMSPSGGHQRQSPPTPHCALDWVVLP